MTTGMAIHTETLRIRQAILHGDIQAEVTLPVPLGGVPEALIPRVHRDILRAAIFLTARRPILRADRTHPAPSAEADPEEAEEASESTEHNGKKEEMLLKQARQCLFFIIGFSLLSMQSMRNGKPPAVRVRVKKLYKNKITAYN